MPFLSGTSADDTIIGGNGDDVIYGLGGGDYIKGGDGRDTVYGSDGNDTISGAEVALGGSGNDLIYASPDGGWFNGGEGADTVVGDSLNFSGIDLRDSSEAVYVDMVNGIAEGGDAEGDVYINLSGVLGTEYDDTLIGGSGTSGYGGDDYIQLGSQVPGQAEGGEGNDTLIGGNLDDLLTIDEGNDYIDGGEGIDYIYISAPADSSNDGFYIDLSEGRVSDPRIGENVTQNVEAIYVPGTTDDTLFGDDQDNLIEAGAGDDLLRGRDGDDTLFGNSGDDTLDGGEGNDTAVYLAYILHGSGGTNITGNTVDLESGFVAGVASDGDTLISIENLRGGSATDVFSGDGNANQLDGEAGNDRLDGRGGNDTLVGGEGDDVLIGGAGVDRLFGGLGNDAIAGGSGNDILYGDVGNDTLDGGSGRDTANYFESAAGVVLSLDGGGTSGQAKGDVYVDIEHVTGSKRSDYITGDDGDNILKGMDGWDTLFGAGGNDNLQGGGGHDVIDGGDGDDVISGGTRNDSLAGGQGNDAIDGGSGRDTLIGGAGDDTLTGGNSADIFVFEAGSGNDVIADFDIEHDMLDMRESAAEFNELTDLIAATTETGDGLLIDLGGGDSLLLQDLTLADIWALLIDF